MSVTIKNWWRFIGGIIVVPIFVLYCIPVLNCLVSPIVGTSNCWAGITGFSWYGLPIVGAAMLVVVPLVFIVLKKGWIAAKLFTLSGALLALVIALILATLDNNLGLAALIISLVPFGAVTAFLFWLVAIRSNVRTSITSRKD